jgi:hypothetical protein
VCFHRIREAKFGFLDASNIKASGGEHIPNGFAFVRITESTHVPRNDLVGNSVSVH